MSRTWRPQVSRQAGGGDGVDLCLARGDDDRGDVVLLFGEALGEGDSGVVAVRAGELSGVADAVVVGVEQLFARGVRRVGRGGGHSSEHRRCEQRG